MSASAKRPKRAPKPAAAGPEADSAPRVFASPAQLAAHFAADPKAKKAPGHAFYAETLRRVAGLAAAGEYGRARAELAEELEAPYIPAAAADAFGLMGRLLAAHEAERAFADLEKLSPRELVARAARDFPKNAPLLAYMAAKPADFFEPTDLDYFQYVFTDPRVPAAAKVDAALALNEVAAFRGRSLRFVNAHTQAEAQIVLTGKELLGPEADAYWKRAYALLDDAFSRDPSLRELAASLTDEIAVFCWPLPPEGFAAEELAAGIASYLYAALGEPRTDRARAPKTAATALIERVLAARAQS